MLNKLNIKKIINVSYIASLLYLPIAIVFWDILGEYTISYGSISNSSPSLGISALPLIDPSAGSHQDEAWLFFIRYFWSVGQIPLINQFNGLGAPFLSSMQSGALYPLNILLLILSPHSSQFFDLFSIAHVVIFSSGLYLLGKEFIRNKIFSALLSGSISSSILVIYNINMVHFRAFAWAPWIAFGLIYFIKKPSFFTAPIIYCFSVFVSFSAGNPQESILDFFAALIVLVAYLVKENILSVKNILHVIMLIISGILISTIGYLPYILGITSQDLWSVADRSRSLLYLGSAIYFLDILIPHGTGYAGAGWVIKKYFYELQFTFPVLWIVAFFGILKSRLNKKSYFWIGTLLFIYLLFILKILGIGYWNWLSYIPILNGIRFTKYTLWTALILFPLVCCGLELLRRNLINKSVDKYSVISQIIITYLFFIALYIANSYWVPPVTSPSFRHTIFLVFLYLISIPILISAIESQKYRIILLAYSIIFSIYSIPAGFYKQIPYENLYSADTPTFVTPANLTDANWINGIHRGAPAFFTLEVEKLSYLHSGIKLRVNSGDVREINNINGDQIWLKGGALLNPSKDGYPNKISIDNSSIEEIKAFDVNTPFQWPRVVDLVEPNRNLLKKSNSPWVFDPVMNRRYRDLITKEFITFNPGFDTMPLQAEKISKRQAEVLRMLGVSKIKGYNVEPNIFYKNISKDFNKLIIEIPEAFFIPSEKVSLAENLFISGRYGEYVDYLLAEGRPCKVRLDGPNGFEVTLPGNNYQSGLIIVNRVFSSGWSSNLGSVVDFGSFWLAKSIKANESTIHFSYWPPGLTNAIILSLLGILMAILLPIYYKIQDALLTRKLATK